MGHIRKKGGLKSAQNDPRRHAAEQEEAQDKDEPAAGQACEVPDRMTDAQAYAVLGLTPSPHHAPSAMELYAAMQSTIAMELLYSKHCTSHSSNYLGGDNGPKRLAQVKAAYRFLRAKTVTPRSSRSSRRARSSASWS